MLGALLAALLFEAPATAEVPLIAPEQAKDHVGEEIEVQGQVAEVGASKDGKTVFLNFGGQYPNHVLNAVILSGNLQSFPEARSWQGKVIKVRGKIQLNGGDGKPVIILERQEQATVESSTTPSEGGVPHGTEGRVEGGIVYGVPGAALKGDLGGSVTLPAMDYDLPPHPIKITRPWYPQEAFQRKIQGTVVVEILIDSQGRVAHARVIQSVPLLDDAALQTVYQWTFQPAVKHGQPVPTIAHAPVAFRISKTKGKGKGTEAPEQREQQPATNPD